MSRLDAAIDPQGRDRRPCVRAPLPEYGVARVVAGQFTADGAIREGESAFGG